MEKGYPLYVANDRFLSMGGYGSYEEFEQDIKGMVINTIHPEDWEYVENEIDCPSVRQISTRLSTGCGAGMAAISGSMTQGV